MPYQYGLLVDGSAYSECFVPRDIWLLLALQRDLQMFCPSAKVFSTGYGPTSLVTMAKRPGVTLRVLGNIGSLSSQLLDDMRLRGCRRPQAYCLEVPREPLRYLLAPGIAL